MAKKPYHLKGMPVNPRVDHYQTLAKIGQGTYGEVFKAKDETGQLVAVKKLTEENKQGGMSKACLREVSVLNILKHRNIVRLLEVCKTSIVRRGAYSSQYFLVFEFCEYELSALIKNKHINFTLGQSKMFLLQILRGLYFMHGNKIMHRDLKPSNILVSKNGLVKIADLGLARPFNSVPDKPNSFTNYVVTLWYRPPELLLGEKKYGPAIDMWSFGCIMAEFWTRVPILRGDSEAKQLDLITQLCGALDPETWPDVKKYYLYNKMVPHAPRKRRLQQHLFPYIRNNYVMDLLNQILVLDPSNRIDADSALNHDFFWMDPKEEDLQPLFSKIEDNNSNSNSRKRPHVEEHQLIHKRRRIINHGNEYAEKVY